MMKIYAEELNGARAYWESNHESKTRAFEPLNPHQLGALETEARRLERWVNRHPRIHNLIGLATFTVILAAQIATILFVRNFWLAAAALAYLQYNLAVYGLHEGAGHGRIIRRSLMMSKLELAMWKALSRLARNSARLVFADPEYYQRAHVRHHADLGTANDGAYTNFILPSRFFKSLLPLAALLPFNDYRIHFGDEWTRSKIFSTVVGSIFSMVLICLAQQEWGLAKSVLLVVFLAPWLGFVLDRLRETSEHNLMPEDAHNGTRDFGCGFFGLLIGGGPWGQPCHLSHHLAPSLPWYFQIKLHFKIKALLSERQKRQFLVRPFEYPMLFIRLLIDTFYFSHEQVAQSNYFVKHLTTERWLTTPHDLEAVRQLRRLSYERAGKTPPPDSDITDSAIKVLGIFKEKTLVATAEIHLPSDSLKLPPERDLSRLRHRPSDTMEISKLCVHPHYHGTNLFLKLLEVIYGELIDQRRSYMLICAEERLVKKYQRIQFRQTGVEFSKDGRWFHLMCAKRRHFGVYGVSAGPILWCIYLKDVFRARNMRHPIYTIYSAFVPLALLLELLFIVPKQTKERGALWHLSTSRQN